MRFHRPASPLMCIAALLALAAPAQDSRSEVARRIDAVFERWNKPGSPGCAIGVFKDGAIVYSRGFGLANLEHDIANTPRTVFDLGSTSKQFTAGCVALLSIEGKLSLDDDIRKHVPEIPDYGNTITIRNLLHHTSGIRDYLPLLMMTGVNEEDLATKDDALSMLSRQRGLCFKPGERHEYSNSGYFLLSVIVERVSGKSLDAFAQERIFHPLGMNDTHIHDDHTRIVPRRATGYGPGPAGTFIVSMSNFEQTGDGSVMTTIEDIQKWDENFYSGKVGGPRFLELMKSRGRLNDGTELTYGFGNVTYFHAGFDEISHGGAWVGYRASLHRFPTEHLSIACLCNLSSMNPSRLCLAVADIMLEGVPKPPSRPNPTADSPSSRRADSAPTSRPTPPTPDQLTPEKLAAYAGTYHSEELDVSWTIAVHDGALHVTSRRLPDTVLRPTSADTFSGAGLLFTFERRDDSVISFVTKTRGLDNLRFVRTPSPSTSNR